MYRLGAAVPWIKAARRNLHTDYGRPFSTTPLVRGANAALTMTNPAAGTEPLTLRAASSGTGARLPATGGQPAAALTADSRIIGAGMQVLAHPVTHGHSTQ